MRIADSNVNARHEGERKAVLLKAVQAIDSLQSKLDAMERDRNEPIAIVGLSCRFPGSQDPAAFWRVLSEGVDAVREVPEGRWDKNAYFDPDPSAPGKMHAHYGGFLDQVDLFDAGFFGISGREAETMDPQQRLLLEVTWEALENAGITSTELRGSSTGVFVGITTSDYARLAVANDSTALDVYTATGGALNVAAGRLSHVFGLNGPAMAVDTACSSSLVAVHLACQSLRGRECDLALAGGVNLLLTPEAFVCFAKWGMMAPDGRCKTFDERADGFVRGEGCGIIALKRLSDAQSAGDRVLALIRGTAVNQDGASSGLTVPSGPAQEAVVRSALKAARLQPHDVDYVEAHGTGTTLGDPIELEALAAVLGKDRPADQPLRVGSVKTNLGHLESASGIAGLIKVVLSMGHQEIPRQLHFQKLNPRISLGGAPIEIPINSVAWPRSERARIAGISSFGFSGTNAHVILQEAPFSKDPITEPGEPDRSAHLLVLSANSETALRDLSSAYAEAFVEGSEHLLPDICHTAAIGRSALSYRLSFPVSNILETKAKLDGFAQGKTRPEVMLGRARADARVAFLFTGQGAQRRGMGRALYETEPVFRNGFDQCALLLGEHLQHPLGEIVGYDTTGPGYTALLDETAYAQPALFAFEYALALLWRSWGIEPAAIVGHSLGEYVGACFAGVLSLEDALRLIAARSRLMQSLPRNGAMAAVFASEAQVRAAISQYTDSVSIAGVNSPLNTVISGHSDDVSALVEKLTLAGVESRLLTVSHAFHSPMVEPILDEFERSASTVEYRLPQIDLVSNLTGNLFSKRSPLEPNYWRRQMREAVRFEDSVRTLHRRGIRAFLEIGPAPVLIGMGRQIITDSETAWLPSLRKDRDEWPQILSSLGALFVLGAKPDWATYDKPHRRRRVALPTYPFQRKRHWLPDASAGSARQRTKEAGHPLLGTHIALAGNPGEHIWIGEMSLESCPWVGDHRVQEVAVVPATAYVEMAIAALVETGTELPVVVSEIEIEKMLTLQPGAEFEIQTRVSPQGAGTTSFQIHSRRKKTKDDWALHVSGVLRTGGIAPSTTVLDAANRERFKNRATRYLDGAEFYELHQVRGNQWGPRFQGVRHVWQGQGEALSEITLTPGIQAEVSRYIFHPAFSDSSGHILTATIPLEKSDDGLGGAFVGAGIEEARIYRRPKGTQFYAYAKLRRNDGGSKNTLVGDVQVYDLSGNLLTETIGARLWYLDSDPKTPDATPSFADWLYEPQWMINDRAEQLNSEVGVGGTWIIFRDQQGVGDAICALLRKRGSTCVCVDHGEQRSPANDAVMTIRPENADDYEGVLRAVARRDTVAGRIVHLWSLDAREPEEANLRDVEHAQTLGTISVLRMVQAMDRFRQTSPPKLWLVTRGAHSTGEKSSPVSILQSPLWGLGRTIAMETGDIWGGQIDLDPDDTPTAAAALLLHHLDAQQENVLNEEDQTAFRGGRRYVLRLARRPETTLRRERIRIREDATYLITGGLGGIGLLLAKWLVARGARHLILAGRSSLPARSRWNEVATGTLDETRITALHEMESLGAKVLSVVVEMGNEESVSELVSLCRQSDRPLLRGVFHAAGVMQYEPLVDHTPDRMREILAPKMVGGWLLHRLLAEVSLDLFVLFSSSSSLLSSPMMGGYSAANVFLDALAHHRRSIGRAALSVNWGTWGEAGMATHFQTREEAKRQGRTGAIKGVGPLPTRDALAALEQLLEEDAVQAGVMRIDWAAWQQAYGGLAVAPYLSLLISGGGSDAQSRKTDGGASREAILDGQPETRAQMLEEYLTKELARILKVPAESIERDLPISNMGFDSLMSIELKNQLEKDLGVSISMARLLKGPTLLELSETVLDSLQAIQSTEGELGGAAGLNEFEEGVL
jgi:acyl transferase domain-containing protein/acyl carrier protein